MRLYHRSHQFALFRGNNHERSLKNQSENNSKWKRLFKNDQNHMQNRELEINLPNIRKCIKVGGLNEPQTNKIIFFLFLLLFILWFLIYLLNEVEIFTFFNRRNHKC